jgi:hypothetical protein
MNITEPPMDMLNGIEKHASAPRPAITFGGHVRNRARRLRRLGFNRA